MRFIGITGHGLTVPAMHRRALEKFPFDSVLLPFNYIMAGNPQYLADFSSLLEVCRQRKIAVQTIKSMLHRPWGEDAHTRNTWYRPLEEQGDIDLAVHWILAQPDLFLNSTGDIHILPRILSAAGRFSAPPADGDMQAMLQRLEMQPLFTE